jgi:hypothetical protein
MIGVKMGLTHLISETDNVEMGLKPISTLFRNRESTLYLPFLLL